MNRQTVFLSLACLFPVLLSASRTCAGEDPVPPQLDVSAVQGQLLYLRSNPTKEARVQREKYLRTHYRGISYNAIPLLAKLVKDPTKEVRYWAAKVLEEEAFWRRPFGDKPKLSWDTQMTVPVLTEMLQEPNLERRRFAAQQLLTQHYIDGHAAIPDLIEIAKNDGEDLHLRRIVVWALGKMEPKAKAAVPVLTNILLHGDKSDGTERKTCVPLDLMAAKALWGITHKADPVLAVMISALDRTKPSTRAYAARLVGEVGPQAERAVSSLLKLLYDQDREVRGSAVGALSRIGPAAKTVVPRIAELINDRSESDRHRRQYIYALVGFGPTAAPAVPLLMELLDHQDLDMYFAAVYALRAIGPAAQAAVPRLIHHLIGNPNAAARVNAAEALGVIGQQSRNVIPALLQALGDQNELVRLYAVKSLGLMGPKAKEATPALMSMKDKGSPMIQKEAERALQRIRGDEE